MFPAGLAAVGVVADERMIDKTVTDRPQDGNAVHQQPQRGVGGLDPGPGGSVVVLNFLERHDVGIPQILGNDGRHHVETAGRHVRVPVGVVGVEVEDIEGCDGQVSVAAAQVRGLRFEQTSRVRKRLGETYLVVSETVVHDPP